MNLFIMTEPNFLTATEAIDLIKQNKLSRYEWVESCINRINERENITQAWTFVDFVDALKQAKKFAKFSWIYRKKCK